jgi:hypothetical protein
MTNPDVAGANSPSAVARTVTSFSNSDKTASRPGATWSLFSVGADSAGAVSAGAADSVCEAESVDAAGAVVGLEVQAPSHMVKRRSAESFLFKLFPFQ